MSRLLFTCLLPALPLAICAGFLVPSPTYAAPNLKISGSPTLTVNGLVIEASLTVINNGGSTACCRILSFSIFVGREDEVASVSSSAMKYLHYIGRTQA